MKKLTAKILILSIPLYGLPIPLAQAVNPKEIQVCTQKDTNWKPTYSRAFTGANKIESRCAVATEAAHKKDCLQGLGNVDTLNEEFKKTYESTCKSAKENIDKVVAESPNQSQKDGFLALEGATNKGAEALGSVASKIDEVIKQSLEKSQLSTDLAKNSVAKITNPANLAKAKDFVTKLEAAQKSAKADPSSLEKSPGSGISVKSANTLQSIDQNLSASAVSAAQSFEFVRQMLTRKKDITTNIAELNKAGVSARNAADGLGRSTDSTTDTRTASTGGGFDPSSLLALAPLAAMLAQKQQTPTTSTDPFQSGITDKDAPPAPLPAAKLNEKSGSGESKPQPSEAKPEEKPSSETPSPYADAFTGEEESPSDITKGGQGGGAPGGNGISASGGSNGGAGGSSEGSGDAKGRSTASNPATEEALQGFGGGGLNFGGGSSSTNSSSESIADPMKDMLTDMEQSVDGVFDANLGDGSDSEQAAGDILMEDSESLFPRVRACHSRALKKGWVLNGLGEKLSELDE
jgi:hypothetical protein